MLRPKGVSKPVKQKKTSMWLVLLPIFGIALVGICVLIAGGTAWVYRDQWFASPAVTQSAGSLTGMPMSQGTPMPQESSIFGLVRFYNGTGFLDEVILTTQGLPLAPAGFQYEAWLTSGESRRSLGVLKVDSTGKAEITSVDNLGQNLLVRFDRVEITLEPNPDSSPNPSGQVAFSSGIPPMALDHIKHLLVAFDETPNKTGMLVGLIQDTTLVDEQANAMLAAYDQQDAAGVRSHAEAIYNLLVGKKGDGYGDLDGDGQTLDPGDGYGLLLNGDQAGYIEGTVDHAQLAAQMGDACEQILHHTPHIVISAKNVEGWAAELRDIITQINSDPLGPDANARIRQAVALADRMLKGRDLNGNETIDPIEGEGGAETALEHATYMIDMPIMAGADRLPPPAIASHDSEPVPTPGY